ncbi:MAG TPA: NAD-dependent epimerase/dehydratase family protein [Streptosporangiaceae bacterium]|jgi:nucleoside-diphosphate-sugar epimerase
MRVLVTGASGHIGSAVVPELLQAGHEVTGLARSKTAAAAVKALGAGVRLGETSDFDGLREAVTQADAIVHLAFNHDVMAAGDMAGAAAMDMATVQAFGDALEGTGKTFIGIGRVNADGSPTASANPRSAVASEISGFTARGIRCLLVAIPPVVHSARDQSGFVPTLIRIAKATGVSGYLGDGATRWPAVHTLDLGRLYRLALEQAPAGSQLIAAAEEGVAVHDIAEVIGRHLNIPALSIPAARATEHFGPFGMVMTLGMPPMSNSSTRQLLGWQPDHPGLIADLDEGHYFTAR